MSTASLMTIRALNVRFGDRQILNDIDASLVPGEIVAVIGPNGAGKTTFLKALAGLVASSGKITFAERDWRSMDPRARARAMAYLEQRGTIAWPLPVSEIIALGRLPFGARDADKDAISRVLDTCGLTAFADRPATDISGGERARVLLARTLASDARILLLDEPVASLDPAWQLGVMDILKMESRAGRCVVAVLHDLSLAMRYADRVLLFASGQLAANAAPQALLASGALESAFGVQFEPVQTNGGLVIGASLPAKP